MQESHVIIDFITANAKCSTLRFSDSKIDSAWEMFKLLRQTENVNYIDMYRITPSRHGENYVPEHCDDLAKFNRFKDEEAI